MFQKYHSKILISFLLIVFLITSGLGCKCSSKKELKNLEPVNLVYWRTQDGKDAFSEIINSFQAIYPHITITYRNIRPEEYEQTLLETWAEDRGPDIFSIPNTWLGKYQTKILPLGLGQELVMPKRIMEGIIKPEPKIIINKIKAPDLRTLRETFVETVPKDILIEEKIYGLPLSLDILALYYNRDILNSGGIINPPQTWQEFVNIVSALTLQDRYGDFIQSGAALGTSNNVNYLTDIVSLLMLQNGTSMVDQNNRAIFNQSLEEDTGYFPAQEAVRFYTGFANPYQEGVYMWNEEMPNSLDAFIQGRTAFMFGYSKDLQIIKTQAPKLSFDIAPLPQISSSLKKVNYAQYWLETVSRKSAHPQEAWTFVLSATQAQKAKTFLEKTKKPTAHRGLIELQLQDFDLAVFAQSSLTAQTWYQGKNYSLVEEAFKEMIRKVLTGEEKIEKAVDYCVQKINLTY